MNPRPPHNMHAPPSEKGCRILAIVLNYRTPDLSLQCAISAYEDLDPILDRVIIVDNNSPDDSADQIEKGLAERNYPGIQLHRSAENGGFAAGNNFGIRTGNAEAYWLLNSDTVIRPGAAQLLFDTLTADPDVGISSPRLEYEDGEPQTSCFRFHSPVSEFLKGASTGILTRILTRWDVPLGVRDEITEVEWTSFACVMIRREVLEKVGLLDEDFFMYFEDADYCRMTRRAGFRIVHNPAARVVHLRGKSSPVKEAGRLKKRRPRYYYASRNRYFRKAYGPLGAALANALWTTGRLVALPREVVGQKQPHTVQSEFFDNWRGSVVPRGSEAP